MKAALCPWRLMTLAVKQGVPEALGMSTEQWVNEHLGGYIKMAAPERLEAVKEMTANRMTQYEVANVLGINQSTVSRLLNANASKEADLRDGIDANALGRSPEIIERALQDDWNDAQAENAALIRADESSESQSNGEREDGSASAPPFEDRKLEVERWRVHHAHRRIRRFGGGAFAFNRPRTPRTEASRGCRHPGGQPPESNTAAPGVDPGIARAKQGQRLPANLVRFAEALFTKARHRRRRRQPSRLH
jgi:transcriptional regulator with XRE-family HTH domain